MNARTMKEKRQEHKQKAGEARAANEKAPANRSNSSSSSRSRKISNNSNTMRSWNNFQAKAYMHWTKEKRKVAVHHGHVLVFKQVRSKF